MDLREIVLSMKTNDGFYKMCVDEKDCLKKCILCKKYLSSNKWGLVLEQFIKNRFNITSCNDKTSGDGVIKGKNVEIKVSLGTSDGQFNFVQLRPCHKIDYYIFMVYDMFVGDLGKVYWFLCPSAELYDLIPEYGGYAHGTVEKLGKITHDNLFRKNIEYCLRPNSLKPVSTKQRKLWELLLQKFQVEEENIEFKI